MERQKAHLENWIQIGETLYGNVSRHPDLNLPDGTFVHTSRVLEISADKKSAKTKNTDYTLGESSSVEAQDEGD